MNDKLYYILNELINNNIATYKLDKSRKEIIKIRYEYMINNKISNIFIYFNKWEDFIKLYKNTSSENRHFYEIIDNECKFFLDLDGKYDELGNSWNKYIDDIKNCLIYELSKLSGNKINIIEFESLFCNEEKKLSSHIIVNDFRFNTEQCKIICENIINKLDKKVSKIIDNKVYNKWRSLKMQGSTKVGSKRVKMLKINNTYIENINLEGFVTNLENTNLFNFLNVIEKPITKKYNNKDFDISNKNLDKYKISINDIVFIKNNYKRLENFINIWHKTYDNFVTYKIINNMILYLKKHPYNCNICKRTHESQNPYIYVINHNIYFDCRRSDNKRVNISHYFNNH